MPTGKTKTSRSGKRIPVKGKHSRPQEERIGENQTFIRLRIPALSYGLSLKEYPVTKLTKSENPMVVKLPKPK